VTGYATPEEAARGGTPTRFVRVVGTVVRGDRAIVAQRMNDRPMYEVELAPRGEKRNRSTGTGHGCGAPACDASNGRDSAARRHTRAALAAPVRRNQRSTIVG
jgi:hypothetical protein